MVDGEDQRMNVADRDRVLEVVCAVISRADGHYLACLRPEGKHLAGYWEFPGGKVEPGETLEEAIAREIREELAVEIEVGERMSAVEWSDDSVVLRLTPLRAHIISGELQAMEHERLEWFSALELGALHWAPADVPIVKRL